MSTDAYRVVVRFDAEKKKFIARMPEIVSLQAEADSRRDALAQLEEAFENLQKQTAEEGGGLPPPIDTTEIQGDLAVTLSSTLRRDLTFLAKQEGVELSHLIGELLSWAVGSRSRSGRGHPHSSERRNDDRPGERRRGGPHGKEYFNIMDDKANFMDYVRKLERGGPPPRRRSR